MYWATKVIRRQDVEEKGGRIKSYKFSGLQLVSSEDITDKYLKKVAEQEKEEK